MHVNQTQKATVQRPARVLGYNSPLPSPGLLHSCLLSQLPDDGGKALVKPSTSVGYLVQTAVGGSEQSAWDEAASGMEKQVLSKVKYRSIDFCVVY